MQNIKHTSIFLQIMPPSMKESLGDSKRQTALYVLNLTNIFQNMIICLFETNTQRLIYQKQDGEGYAVCSRYFY